MKKVLLMFVVGAFMSVSMISCSNCGHCTIGPIATSSKICKKDGEQAYNDAKAECTATLGTWANN